MDLRWGYVCEDKQLANWQAKQITNCSSVCIVKRNGKYSQGVTLPPLSLYLYVDFKIANISRKSWNCVINLMQFFTFHIIHTRRFICIWQLVYSRSYSVFI